jgi:hypothetical protein
MVVVSGETDSGCGPEPGSVFRVLVRTDTDVLPYGRNQHQKLTILPQIAVINRRFSPIFGVGIANLHEPTPTISNESIT